MLTSLYLRRNLERSRVTEPGCVIDALFQRVE
jgi:hypothetical protein